MEQRLAFIAAVLQRRGTFRAVCAQFQISEKTGYKWLDRHHRGGVAGLADASRAPHTSPHTVPRAQVAAIVALRARHPTWGARKLKEVLQARHPGQPWPAASTITAVLRREGVPLRPRRAPVATRAAWAQALTPADTPNRVWAADFKGEFPVRTGPRCYPLTVSDLCSRYVLACEALPSPAGAGVRARFEALFRRYGLPEVLRTDHGVPFAQVQALGALSPLSVWWIRLGIKPERIAKGKPQQNGCHERMHRTLKAEATRPAAATLAQQQARFTAWQQVFNTERPHEALGQTPPAQHYAPSPRPYPRRLPPLASGADCVVRRVTPGGAISLGGEVVFLSTVLAGEEIGLHLTGDGELTLRFGPLVLGVYAERDRVFREAVAWQPLTP